MFTYQFTHAMADLTVRANDESLARHSLHRMGMALSDANTCPLVESDDPNVTTTSGDPLTDRIIAAMDTKDLLSAHDAIWGWDRNDMIEVA